MGRPADATDGADVIHAVAVEHAVEDIVHAPEAGVTAIALRSRLPEAEAAGVSENAAALILFLTSALSAV